MAKPKGAMHVAVIRRQHKDKVYETVLLRSSYREGGKVKNQTLANLTALPPATIELIRQSLAGKAQPMGDGFKITRSLPHGHVAAVWSLTSVLGLPALLGAPCRPRDLALAAIVGRVSAPPGEGADSPWWADTTMAVDLDLGAASTDEIQAASDWLLGHRKMIEAAISKKPSCPISAELCDYPEEALAAHVTWHLTRRWTPLISEGIAASEIARVLRNLATLTRNTVVSENGNQADKLAVPTATQQRAFDLLGVPAIPLVLTT